MEGDVFVLIKAFTIIFIFKYLRSLNCQSTIKLGGHRTCLGDIVQNIAKMNIFAHFPRGAWCEFYNFNLSN